MSIGFVVLCSGFVALVVHVVFGRVGLMKVKM